MKKLLLPLCIATVLLSACGKTSFEATTHKRYEPQSKRDVLLYSDARPVPKDAEEIGIIRYKAGNIKKASKRSKKLAARHGGNALYAIKPMKDIAFAGSRGQFKVVYQKP